MINCDNIKLGIYLIEWKKRCGGGPSNWVSSGKLNKIIKSIKNLYKIDIGKIE